MFSVPVTLYQPARDVEGKAANDNSRLAPPKDSE
jgi:hypothetical protein